MWSLAPASFASAAALSTARSAVVEQSVPTTIVRYMVPPLLRGAARIHPDAPTSIRCRVPLVVAQMHTTGVPTGTPLTANPSALDMARRLAAGGAAARR